MILLSNVGFSGGSNGEESACNAGDPGSIPGLGRSPGEEMATHSRIIAWDRGASWALGQSLVSNSPWGHKESGTIELDTHTQGRIIFFFKKKNWTFISGFTSHFRNQNF